MKLIPNSIAVFVPVLQGASNWKTWQEKFQTVTRTTNPLYWEIFMGNLTVPVYDPYTSVAIDKMASKHKLPAEVFTRPVFEAYLELDDLIKQQLRSDYDASVEIWNCHVTGARDYLTFALGEKPALQIKEIADPRTAYLKLEALYSNLQIKPNFNAWKKWMNLRYERTHPVAFVRRFKKLVRDVRDQGIQVSGDVELAQFRSVIMQRPSCLQFAANLRVDSQMDDHMNSVYTRFIRQQLYQK
ncbi:hypothetical protein N7457_006408 [Penicillium paradoxum]|uniref:uncharacterized protein n=1 Tax=Penicillium paradoxum TaxID=176176 RepID=UPI0025482CB5|nr:uncharacterized protein N7457_006408 [Penicillium paradoxum]KAJ5781248.1 hypothetical protein N7457_006408 [Penicillium paradoxum]